MTDIAEIGFRVDTSQLEKAEQKLNRLPAAAAGVDAANIKMAKLAEAAGAATAAAATAGARAANLKAQSTLKALRANQEASKEEIKAAAAIERRTAAVLADTKAEQARVNQLNKAATALRANNALEVASNRPSNRVSNVASSGRVQNAGPARDQMPNRFNTANIAAQFQDIGVTAAMGMNPLQIALQQGTQLSAIMQSMESPLKGLAVALKSVFNAVSLGTIAFVAIIAALLQMVNWTKVAQAVLRGLADACEVAIPYVLGLAAALALLYSRTIIVGIAAVVTSIYEIGSAALVAGTRMAAAWVIGLGPIGWVIAGLVVVGAAFQALGVNIVGYIKDAMNGIIGAIAYALNKISELINNSIEKIQKYRKVIQFLPGVGAPLALGAGLVGNRRVGNVVEPGKEFSTDYVGQGVDAANKLGKSAANSLRNLANGLGKDKGEKGKKDPWEELVKGADRTIATLKSEQAAIGMTEEATAKLKYQTDLLNEAQQKNIKLTPEQIIKIDQLSTTMAKTEAQTKSLKDAYDFLRDAGKGFISDLRSGLEEGKSLWESFASAVKGVIDKIINKLLDSQINNLISSVFAPQGGGAGGGLLSSIAGFFGGGGGDNVAGVPLANLLPGFANGGAFQNGVQKFAAGGVVHGATNFGMASGKTGVMGEAGPEAIMPLHRGPDGSLGVKMNGASNDNSAAAQQPSVTYVINAPGASKADLEAVKQTIMAVAGPGVVEQRVMVAQTRGVAV